MVNAHAFTRPFGECRISVAVEGELFDTCVFDGFFDLVLNLPFSDGCSVRVCEDKTFDVGDRGAAFPLGSDLF